MAKTAKKTPPPAPPADLMPRRVDPCVATLVDKPPKGPEWAFEVKWDGYRLAVHVEPGEVRVITRGGYDWTKKFGSIVAEARQLGHASMIIDGEAVVLDEQGRSDFGLLQRAVGKKPSLHEPSEIIFYAFDLLYLDGHDLRSRSLAERRGRLEPIVAGRTGAIRFSEEVHADGAEFFRAACELGLEGIIAKRRDAPYRSGRRPEWLKIKCARRDTFVIVGYEPSTMPRAIGRLLLAAKKGNGLVYVGGCGTGWSNEESVQLRELLDAIPVARPPVTLKRKDAVFSEPLLAAEVEYRAWTQDGKLRHPSFKGVKKRARKVKVYSLDK
ncbi:non-homologous end-joining DNA ligase [Sinorhizobium fredii]|uniref:non-homologous end-joining DNA ligase n=1 Tax=Rhizobium fredii TaxID=380 RepID=UPI0004B13AA2|nr:non-homologous end-joining DNA ligase [Sinorhizobium fredii]ASY74362.1 ATP-dependent DNA ligase clustered with Ku protein, LigD [Sinorhizobium fredii CCBAU 83666]